MNCLLLGESLRSEVNICILNTGFPAGLTSLLREAACFAGVVVTSDASTSGVSVVYIGGAAFSTAISRLLPATFSPL